MRAEVELLLLEADPGAVRLLRWPLAVVDEGQRRWRAAGRRPEKTEEEAGVGGAPAAVVEEGPRRWPAAPANPKSRGACSRRKRARVVAAGGVAPRRRWCSLSNECSTALLWSGATTVVVGGSGVVVGVAEDGGGATVMGIGDFSRGRDSNGEPPSGAP